MSKNHTLPDITSNKDVDMPLPLQWVGMEQVAVPLKIGEELIPAKANVFVSLDDASAKGIHMSRLYKKLNELQVLQCNNESLHHLLASMMDTQQGSSRNAKLVLDFELLLKKPSLSKQAFGFQSYPISINSEFINNTTSIVLNITIPYSSTCPCSASLSRQAYSQAIDKTFSGEQINKADLLKWVESLSGSVATPHSQRSYAYLSMQLKEGEWPDLDALIIDFEKVLGTPVQTAVKRADELAFAKLNAENLMFCEDAARRIKSALLALNWVQDFWFKVEHQESLHAHNAVVIDSKNNRFW